MMSKRSATPADFQKLFADLGELAGMLTSPDTLTLSDVLRIFNQIETDLQAFATPPILEAVTRFRAGLPTAEKPTARDWAGFFQALAAFTQSILPLILDIFKK